MSGHVEYLLHAVGWEVEIDAPQGGDLIKAMHVSVNGRLGETVASEMVTVQAPTDGAEMLPDIFELCGSMIPPWVEASDLVAAAKANIEKQLTAA